MQSWDQSWEAIYRQQEREKYPSESVIRFMARNYYGLRSRSDVRILDLGCGSGNNLWYLAQEGFSAYGIDGSETAISRAKQRLHSQGLEAHLQVVDFISIPYPDEYFDVVIDKQSVQHNTWQYVVRTVSEVHRVLCPGGRLLSLMLSVECSEYVDRLRYGGEEIERHTVVGLRDCAFEGVRVVHFFDEEEIRTLMSPFDEVYIGYEKRIERQVASQNSTDFTLWIVEAQKATK